MEDMEKWVFQNNKKNLFWANIFWDTWESHPFKEKKKCLYFLFTLERTLLIWHTALLTIYLFSLWIFSLSHFCVTSRHISRKDNWKHFPDFPLQDFVASVAFQVWTVSVCTVSLSQCTALSFSESFTLHVMLHWIILDALSWTEHYTVHWTPTALLWTQPVRNLFLFM